MHCDLARERLTERLSQTLPDEATAALEQHLSECADCRTEAADLAHTWQLLDAIDTAPPDAARLRAFVDAAISANEHGQTNVTDRPRRAPGFGRWPLNAAAALALLAAGAGAGRYMAPQQSVPTGDISAMREELHDLRQMVTLTLLQQQSASERLKGITWAQAIDQPGTDLTAALLDTLMHDPNVNVRLATIDALKRFSGRENVRRGAVDALAQQTSPLVQIALIDFVVEVSGREASSALERLSRDTTADEAVRARAARGLATLG